MQTYTLTVRPLTGIHIGNGEELSPLDYKLDKAKNGKTVYLKYSSDKILRRLIAEKKELAAFERASASGNIGEMQAFFQKNCVVADVDYPCDVTDEFERIYYRNRAKDPIDNASGVLQMYRPGGCKYPVIPGSSMKGSIRTAVLNLLLVDLGDDDYKTLLSEESGNNKLQKSLLHYDDAKNDPFRCVSISDSVFPVKNTQLVGLLKNISRNKNQASLFALDKLQIQAESIKGELLDGGACAQTSLAIDTDLLSLSCKAKISIEKIIEACNHFYWNEFESEYRKFYEDIVDGTTGIIEELKKRLDNARKEKNQFIIRLGRWSQVEFVTFNEDFRKPNTKRRGRDMGWG
ncbi:MAG: type III-A CRISPR-associated RAMP protein Csm5, partial [Spirochaetia bacterium]|nr:type III-A CRISPR-associated RAMP protein Csm5 [Spirochaetia bacterium]